MVTRFPRISAANQLKVPCSRYHQWTRQQSAAGDEYQCLQRSPVTTSKFQTSLPRLPIPDLSKTCNRYMASQEAFIGDDEKRLKEIRNAIRSFLRSEGPILDKLVRKRDLGNQHTSFAQDPATRRSLGNKSPIPFSQTTVLPLVNGNEHSGMLHQATNLVISVLRYFQTCRRDLVNPLMMNLGHDERQCLSQEAKFMPDLIASPLSSIFGLIPLSTNDSVTLFQSARLPGQATDVIKTHKAARHILVAHRGNFYTFDGLDDDYRLVGPAYYFSCIKTILEHGLESRNSEELGLLTALGRETWQEARQNLVKDPHNMEILEEIESALMVIALDDSLDEKDFISDLMMSNVWSDKPLTFHVSSNGSIGARFDNSSLNILPVLRFLESVRTDIERNSFDVPINTLADAKGLIHHLQPNCSFRTLQDINIARHSYMELSNSVDMVGFEAEISQYDIKDMGAAIAAIAELAFLRCHKELASISINCDHVPFKAGKPTNIYPLTQEVKQFCTQASSGCLDAEAMRVMLDRCSISYYRQLLSAMKGQGWEQHLMALEDEHVHEYGESKPLPDIFADLKQISTSKLAISEVPSSRIRIGGQMPLVDEGYALMYQLSGNGHVRFFVSGRNMDCQQLSEEIKNIIEELSFNNLNNIVKRHENEKD